MSISISEERAWVAEESCIGSSYGEYVGPHDVSRSLGKDNSNAHGDPGRSSSRYLRTYLIYEYNISTLEERAWVAGSS